MALNHFNITPDETGLLPSSVSRACAIWRKHIWLFGALLSITIACGSCTKDSSAAYSQFVHIAETGIPEGWEYEFNPLPTDSTLLPDTSFDEIIVVRYTNSFSSKSVILNIEEVSLEHERPDSLEIKLSLFSNKGRPLGKGNYGIYEVSDTIRKGIKIPEGYSVSVSSPLPGESTVGIKAIGIILSESSLRPFRLWPSR